MQVPPFLRVDKLSADQNAEMQMVAAGQSAQSGDADFFFFFDAFADGCFNGGKMSVQAEQPNP